MAGEGVGRRPDGGRPAVSVWDAATGEAKGIESALAADLVEVKGFPLLPLAAWPEVAADMLAVLSSVEADRRSLWKKFAALQDAARSWAVSRSCGGDDGVKLLDAIGASEDKIIHDEG